MTTPTIDALALHAARLSRRRSLLTLGGAAMALTTVAAVEPGYARKKNKNNKNRNKNRNKNKNGGKGKVANCKTLEEQRCANDAATCKASLQPLCNEDNVAACLAIKTCCERCSAGGFLTCLIEAEQV